MKFVLRARALAAAAVLAAGFLAAGCRHDGDPNAPQDSDPATNAPPTTTVALSGDQLNSIKIGPVETYRFPILKSGIGSIDFQNNLYSDASLSTQIFPPTAGSITKIFVELGDEVKKTRRFIPSPVPIKVI